MGTGDEFGAAFAHGLRFVRVTAQMRYRGGKRGALGRDYQAALALAHELGLTRQIGDDRWQPASEDLIELERQHAGRRPARRIGNGHQSRNRSRDQLWDFFIRPIAETADGSAAFLRGQHVRLLFAGADDDELDRLWPARMAHRIDHQVDAVPAGQAAEEYDKGFWRMTRQRSKQHRVGSIGNNGNGPFYAFAAQPLRELACDRQKVSRAQPLRTIEPGNQARRRLEPG